MVDHDIRIVSVSTPPTDRESDCFARRLPSEPGARCRLTGNLELSAICCHLAKALLSGSVSVRLLLRLFLQYSCLFRLSIAVNLFVVYSFPDWLQNSKWPLFGSSAHFALKLSLTHNSIHFMNRSIVFVMGVGPAKEIKGAPSNVLSIDCSTFGSAAVTDEESKQIRALSEKRYGLPQVSRSKTYVAILTVFLAALPKMHPYWYSECLVFS